MDAQVNLQVCIYFAMSTYYKEYIRRVVCLTLVAFGVHLFRLFASVLAFHLLQFNEAATPEPACLTVTFLSDLFFFIHAR